MFRFVSFALCILLWYSTTMAMDIRWKNSRISSFFDDDGENELVIRKRRNDGDDEAKQGKPATEPNRTSANDSKRLEPGMVVAIVIVVLCVIVILSCVCYWLIGKCRIKKDENAWQDVFDSQKSFPSRRSRYWRPTEDESAWRGPPVFELILPFDLEPPTDDEADQAAARHEEVSLSDPSTRLDVLDELDKTTAPAVADASSTPPVMKHSSGGQQTSVAKDPSDHPSSIISPRSRFQTRRRSTSRRQQRNGELLRKSYTANEKSMESG